MRVRTGFMWLTIYRVWGFYEYSSEHKRGDFRGWATVTIFMSVSSIDDSWIKSNFLGQKVTTVTLGWFANCAFKKSQ